jgi:DNA-binding MarR family transcriptional regulator
MSATISQVNTRAKLTFRQKSFLGKLLDIYGESGLPLHYSTIAGRLGLSNSSAYDMLRVLEQKDMVGTQYTTPKEVAGPGRANVLFYPTDHARNVFSRVAHEFNEHEEWENLKAGLLKSLRQVRAAGNSRELLREMLSGAPSARTPLAQCAQIVTAFLLSLEEAGERITDKRSISSIVRSPVSKLRMSILTGLVLGISLADKKVSGLLGNYSKYTDKYESSLQKLNREGLVKLHRFIQDAWDTLEAESVK